MDGLLALFEFLGAAVAQVRAENRRLLDENEALRAALSALEAQRPAAG